MPRTGGRADSGAFLIMLFPCARVLACLLGVMMSTCKRRCRRRRKRRFLNPKQDVSLLLTDY